MVHHSLSDRLAKVPNPPSHLLVCTLPAQALAPDWSLHLQLASEGEMKDTNGVVGLGAGSPQKEVVHCRDKKLVSNVKDFGRRSVSPAPGLIWNDVAG